jgi:hypothetical protein
MGDVATNNSGSFTPSQNKVKVAVFVITVVFVLTALGVAIAAAVYALDKNKNDIDDNRKAIIALPTIPNANDFTFRKSGVTTVTLQDLPDDVRQTINDAVKAPITASDLPTGILMTPITSRDLDAALEAKVNALGNITLPLKPSDLNTDIKNSLALANTALQGPLTLADIPVIPLTKFDPTVQTKVNNAVTSPIALSDFSADVQKSIALGKTSVQSPVTSSDLSASIIASLSKAGKTVTLPIDGGAIVNGSLGIKALGSDITSLLASKKAGHTRYGHVADVTVPINPDYDHVTTFDINPVYQNNTYTLALTDDDGNAVTPTVIMKDVGSVSFVDNVKTTFADVTPVDGTLMLNFNSRSAIRTNARTRQNYVMYLAYDAAVGTPQSIKYFYLDSNGNVTGTPQLLVDLSGPLATAASMPFESARFEVAFNGSETDPEFDAYTILFQNIGNVHVAPPSVETWVIHGQDNVNTPVAVKGAMTQAMALTYCDILSVGLQVKWSRLAIVTAQVFKPGVGADVHYIVVDFSTKLASDEQVHSLTGFTQNTEQRIVTMCTTYNERVNLVYPVDGKPDAMFKSLEFTIEPSADNSTPPTTTAWTEDATFKYDPPKSSEPEFGLMVSSARYGQKQLYVGVLNQLVPLYVTWVSGSVGVPDGKRYVVVKYTGLGPYHSHHFTRAETVYDSGVLAGNAKPVISDIRDGFSYDTFSFSDVIVYNPVEGNIATNTGRSAWPLPLDDYENISFLVTSDDKGDTRVIVATDGTLLQSSSTGLDLVIS